MIYVISKYKTFSKFAPYMTKSFQKRFLVLSQITLLFVFLVIIAGAVVRASGSGMGCPDWPKCFGKIIPPTNINELPANYKELYAGEHHAVEDFNALKTWTEYINRLFGAVLGFLIFLQFIFSFKFFKNDRIIFVLSFIEFILIGFEAWLGAKVVSSNLAPVKITTHMAASLVILSVGLAIVNRIKGYDGSQLNLGQAKKWKSILVIVLFLSVLQIVLGTQVREDVDVLLKNFDEHYRNQIIDNLGLSFIIHRSFSILILLLNGWLIYSIVKQSDVFSLNKTSKLLAVVLLFEIVVGVVLSRMGLPAFVQPIHLLLACIMYALQFWLFLKVRRA